MGRLFLVAERGGYSKSLPPKHALGAGGTRRKEDRKNKINSIKIKTTQEPVCRRESV